MNSFLFCFMTFTTITFNLVKADECIDYEEYKKNLCSSIELEGNNHCALYNNECIQMPKDCTDYKGDDKNFCELIPPNSKYKCIFKNNTCQKENRTCSDFKKDEPLNNCHENRHLNGECYPDNYRNCIEIYEKCDIAKNKTFCESMILISNEKKCSWIDNTCVEETVNKCSDLNFRSCKNYYFTPEDRQKKCEFINGKCIEMYRDCTYYKGNIKEECESIIPEYYDIYYGYVKKLSKCVFENNQCIEVKKDTCSNKPSLYGCQNIILNDTNKYCLGEDYQCNEYFRECEYYKGTDKDECEKNIPLEGSNGIFNSDKYKRKCVFRNNKCITVPRESCSEFKKGEEEKYCKNIVPLDELKYCKLVNQECKEFYKDCYNIKDKYECISNIPLRNIGCKFTPYFHYCLSLDSGNMNCSLFQEFINPQKCESIIPSNFLKKCVFSGNNCYEKDKKCLDFKKNVTKEICENAPTSMEQNKCIINEEKDECIEVDREGKEIIKTEEEDKKDEK